VGVGADGDRCRSHTSTRPPLHRVYSKDFDAVIGPKFGTQVKYVARLTDLRYASCTSDVCVGASITNVDGHECRAGQTDTLYRRLQLTVEVDIDNSASVDFGLVQDQASFRASSTATCYGQTTLAATKFVQHSVSYAGSFIDETGKSIGRFYIVYQTGCLNTRESTSPYTAVANTFSLCGPDFSFDVLSYIPASGEENRNWIAAFSTDLARVVPQQWITIRVSAIFNVMPVQAPFETNVTRSMTVQLYEDVTDGGSQTALSSGARANLDPHARYVATVSMVDVAPRTTTSTTAHIESANIFQPATSPWMNCLLSSAAWDCYGRTRFRLGIAATRTWESSYIIFGYGGRPEVEASSEHHVIAGQGEPSRWYSWLASLKQADGTTACWAAAQLKANVDDAEISPISHGGRWLGVPPTPLHDVSLAAAINVDSVTLCRQSLKAAAGVEAGFSAFTAWLAGESTDCAWTTAARSTAVAASRPHVYDAIRFDADFLPVGNELFMSVSMVVHELNLGQGMSPPGRRMDIVSGIVAPPAGADVKAVVEYHRALTAARALTTTLPTDTAAWTVADSTSLKLVADAAVTTLTTVQVVTITVGSLIFLVISIWLGMYEEEWLRLYRLRVVCCAGILQTPWRFSGEAPRRGSVDGVACFDERAHGRGSARCEARTLHIPYEEWLVWQVRCVCACVRVCVCVMEGVCVVVAWDSGMCQFPRACNPGGIM
jgi:hypothetical protein